MNPAHLLMLAVLAPAAVNPSLLAQGTALAVPLCSAEGSTQQLIIRLGDPVLPGSKATLCCAKGCHGSEKRKRVKAQTPI